jgi:hypothetical protein
VPSEATNRTGSARIVRDGLKSAEERTVGRSDERYCCGTCKTAARAKKRSGRAELYRSGRKPADIAQKLDTPIGGARDGIVSQNADMPFLPKEAKSLVKDLNDRKWVSQNLSYATVVGVQWCVLTNEQVDQGL